MYFSRRPVFFFALVAVALAVAQGAPADEVKSQITKVTEDVKTNIDSFQKNVADAYDKLSPETKQNIASAMKTFQDTITGLQQQASTAMKNANVEETFKNIQQKATDMFKPQSK